MERILRGALRFSCGGFTYLRIASRLCVNAASETSAHTGRRTSLRGLFCVPAMGLPNKIVYAIPTASARRHKGCRVNDNTPIATRRPFFPYRASFHAGLAQVYLVNTSVYSGGVHSKQVKTFWTLMKTGGGACRG